MNTMHDPQTANPGEQGLGPLGRREWLLDQGIPLPDGPVTVLDSHFNANPGSMRADLDAYNALAPTLLSKGGRKIGFVGAMRELGNLEISSHNELWQWLREAKFSALYLVGKEFQAVEGIAGDAATRRPPTPPHPARGAHLRAARGRLPDARRGPARHRKPGAGRRDHRADAAPGRPAGA